jgi:sterol desaturase/sphingolipid hydroxylase (fatty acid hydroxylase superfamily)
MTELLSEALLVLLQPLAILLHPREPWSVYYLAGAFVCATALYAIRRRGRLRRGWRGLAAFAFPKRIFAHPSAKVDYAFFLANAIAGPLIFGAAIASSGFWRDLAAGALDAALGPGATGGAANWQLTGAVTLAIFLAVELGYWLSHLLLHRLPVLWEIHKVHHSAEVLTPATAARVHPLEDVLISNVVSICAGAVYGVTVHAFGAGAHQLTLFEVNAIFLVFYVTVYHLRHSHVWLRAPGVLAYVVHSPAHHQIHHSADPRHRDRNLGFALAFWDWVFGTLWVPGRRERLAFGIGPESKEFRSVARLYALPFAKLARRFAGRPQAQAAAGAAHDAAVKAPV